MAYVSISDSTNFSAIPEGYTFLCKGISCEGILDVFVPSLPLWTVQVNGIYQPGFDECYAPLDGLLMPTFFIAPENSIIRLTVSYQVDDTIQHDNSIQARLYGTLVLTRGIPPNLVVGKVIPKKTDKLPGQSGVMLKTDHGYVSAGVRGTAASAPSERGGVASTRSAAKSTQQTHPSKTQRSANNHSRRNTLRKIRFTK